MVVILGVFVVVVKLFVLSLSLSFVFRCFVFANNILHLKQSIQVLPNYIKYILYAVYYFVTSKRFITKYDMKPLRQLKMQDRFSLSRAILLPNLDLFWDPLGLRACAEYIHHQPKHFGVFFFSKLILPNFVSDLSCSNVINCTDLVSNWHLNKWQESLLHATRPRWVISVVVSQFIHHSPFYSSIRTDNLHGLNHNSVNIGFPVPLHAHEHT